MEPQRQTVTDHLADVIHLIYLGGKSGVLTVERGENGAVEIGFIAFENGRVVDATVGTQVGLAAFNYLSTWQRCRFSLVSNSVRENTDKLFTPPPVQRPPAARQVVSPNTTQPLQKPSDSALPIRIPVRLKAGEDALQQPGNKSLSRMQRHLLLLIDGQRDINNLAHLVRRSFTEVQELLNDLQRNGYIQL